jgi:hypothetical protein
MPASAQHVLGVAGEPSLSVLEVSIS